MSIVLFVLLLGLIIINVPIAFAIGFACLTYLFVKDINLALVAQRSATGIYSYPFLALPMFVFAGVLMEHGGITQRMMRLANAVIGHISGGLAAVTVAGSALFGALSGSAIGDTAAIGSIMIPAMKAKNYAAGFAAALQGCSGVLASLIPPSLTMVILGATGNISIAGLLIGGLVPGLLMALLLIIVSLLISRRRGYGKGERATWREFISAVSDSVLPLLLPVIILGGILGGIVTVTEAAVLAVVYAFLLSAIIYREVKISDLPAICMQVVRIAVPVQLIVAISHLFVWIVATEQIPQQLTAFFAAVAPDPMTFLILLNFLLLLLGTFMESNALIIILIPILMPVVNQYGIDPLHFGVMFVVNLCIGANTPPLGVTLMTGAKIAGVRFAEASRAVLPFLAAMVIVLILTILFPKLSTFLPSLFL
ncbi:C4-dicarboxylate transporter, DctM subunit [Nitratireductor aquibiodomus]|uniref:TRAP transporter large permease protein n=1 Tax=Nitratireductor aquibiodomus TaxID=204799 RepID=A0A1H4LTR4_9HYPH|nr:TRAP transporter large permease [Nitratireductor aquibiodomus]SEB73592.1 C4-dicarboxylate transporter, DctM subunit [Nitratireductor aquibiodomus]